MFIVFEEIFFGFFQFLEQDKQVNQTEEHVVQRILLIGINANSEILKLNAHMSEIFALQFICFVPLIIEAIVFEFVEKILETVLMKRN